MKALSFLVLFFTAAGSAHAVQLYTLDFGGSFPYPEAAGSFEFDSSTDQFVNFNVSWNGAVFDSMSMTQEINDYSSAHFSCPGASGTGELEILEILTQPQLCEYNAWAAYSEGFGGGTELFGFQLYLGGLDGVEVIDNEVVLQGSTSPSVGANGGVTAFDIAPEPAPLPLCLVGGALLACKRRKSAANYKASSTSCQ